MIHRVPDERGWVSYHCPLPIYKKQGEKHISERSTSTAVRTTLSILFELLNLDPEEDTKYEIPQLVVVDNFLVQEERNGSSLSAIITPAMIPFLSNPESDSLKSIEEVMRTADEHMWQEKKRSKLFESDFRVHFYKSPKIHLSVQGDACGLDPAHYSGIGCGYRLVPHNVDSGIQQLSLLMGLARLHELGRSFYI